MKIGANLSTVTRICGRCRQIAVVGRWPVLEVRQYSQPGALTIKTTDIHTFKPFSVLVLTWHLSSAAVGDCLISDIAPTNVSIPLS